VVKGIIYDITPEIEREFWLEAITSELISELLQANQKGG